MSFEGEDTKNSEVGQNFGRIVHRFKILRKLAIMICNVLHVVYLFYFVDR